MGSLRRLGPVLAEYCGELAFWCPGCRCMHVVNVHEPRGDNGALWTWNGNVEKPTFRASVLLRGTELTEMGLARHDAWSQAGFPPPMPALEWRPSVCHCFVTDGAIEFLGDTTHKLSGRTVPLPPWPEGILD